MANPQGAIKMKNSLFDYVRKTVLVSMLTIPLFITSCMHTLPSQYYLLSPIKDTAAASNPDAAKINVIGVGPIKFPKYLNRVQLVRFSGDNEPVERG